MNRESNEQFVCIDDLKAFLSLIQNEIVVLTSSQRAGWATVQLTDIAPSATTLNCVTDDRKRRYDESPAIRLADKLRWLQRIHSRVDFLIRELGEVQKLPIQNAIKPPLLDQAFSHLLAPPSSKKLSFDEHRQDIELWATQGHALSQTRLKGLSSLDYKSFFNKFFAEDLYGKFDNEDNLILSGGSLHQDEFPPPESLKFFLEFAAKRNWVGYSHSLGRHSARRPIAELENEKFGTLFFTSDHIALTLGVTSGLAAMLRFLIDNVCVPGSLILTHSPNYAPFLAACCQVAKTKTVPIEFAQGSTPDASTIIDSLTEGVGILLITSDLNPLGLRWSQEDLRRVSDECARRGVYFILDQAAGYFPRVQIPPECLMNPYLIRFDGLSKKCGIPGLKLGYFVASPALVSKYYEFASTNYGGAASFFYLLQEFDARFDKNMLAAVPLIPPEEKKEIETEYGISPDMVDFLYREYRATRSFNEIKVIHQRDFVSSVVQRHMPNLFRDMVVPQTGINVFCEVNSPLDNYRFFRLLLERTRVAVFPGVCCCHESGAWIRITATCERRTLVAGMHCLIDFLKEHYIRGFCDSSAILSKTLLQIGGYDLDPQLNFFSHLYDVYETALRLIPYLRRDIRDLVNVDLIRDACLVHDAGKVIAVITDRAHRVRAISQKIKGGVATGPMLEQWSDSELLGLKNELQRGEPIEWERIMGQHPSVAWAINATGPFAGLPTKDSSLSLRCLELALQVVRETSEIDRWKNARAVLLSNENHEPPTNPISVAALILNLADKLADSLRDKPITTQRLENALAEKEVYVLWRYVSKNILSEADNRAVRRTVAEDFHRSRQQLSTCFDVRTSEVIYDRAI